MQLLHQTLTNQDHKQHPTLPDKTFPVFLPLHLVLMGPKIAWHHHPQLIQGPRLWDRFIDQSIAILWVCMYHQLMQEEEFPRTHDPALLLSLTINCIKGKFSQGMRAIEQWGCYELHCCGILPSLRSIKSVMINFWCILYIIIDCITPCSVCVVQGSNTYDLLVQRTAARSSLRRDPKSVSAHWEMLISLPLHDNPTAGIWDGKKISPRWTSLLETG